ncbi:hypothetical protein CMV_027092 [Castanea mollissima]|uniref:Uncharacterized protein n=1 Tax=Castanea mollissima TaxID=60419 RepID=A0A8J4QC60_9ROSI|nr:hypothetical protein CMV_027092 [Castanea mollissima]
MGSVWIEGLRLGTGCSDFYWPESEFIEEIAENILKKLNEESRRHNDAPGQHSSATIPHNDASGSWKRRAGDHNWDEDWMGLKDWSGKASN